MSSLLALALLLAPPADPVPVVVVGGLGLAPSAATLPTRSGGLLARLRRAGFRPVPLPLQPGADLTASGRAMARAVRAAVGDQPTYALGHGLGGAQLAAAAPSLPGLRGWAGVSAPLGFGGRTRAAQVAWQAVAAAPGADWRAWGDAALRGRPVVRLALTRDGLRPDLRQALFARHLAPAPAQLARWLATRAHRSTPTPNAAGRGLAARPDVRVVAVVAPADGLWAPWQCDPVTLRVRLDAERRVVTRADEAPELSHLDLWITPAALDHVHDPVVATLRRWRASGE